MGDNHVIGRVQRIALAETGVFRDNGLYRLWPLLWPHLQMDPANPYTPTVLHEATQDGKIDIVTNIVLNRRGKNKWPLTSRGYAPLMAAATGRHLESGHVPN